MKRNGAPGEAVGRVSGEIETLRQELGGLVGELDRRRHEAFDLRLQARRHPVVVAALAASAALVVGGIIAVAVGARRHRRRPTVRARETRRALARLLDHPERVASEPSSTNKILTAVATLVATTVAKRIIDRKVMPSARQQ